MSNITILIGLPVGIIGFLFLFWRRLKEDYPVDQIFSFGFTILGFLLSGLFIGLFLKDKIGVTPIFNPKGLWFWLALLFGAAGFGVGFMKLKMRFFESLEAAALGFLFLSFDVSILTSIQTLDFKLLLFSLFQFLLILSFFVIDIHYKRLSWYKSGKVGFAGLMILGTFFLSRAVLALINPTMISFIGKFDAIISSIVAFIFFMILYNLSEQ